MESRRISSCRELLSSSIPHRLSRIPTTNSPQFRSHRPDFPHVRVHHVNLSHTQFKVAHSLSNSFAHTHAHTFTKGQSPRPLPCTMSLRPRQKHQLLAPLAHWQHSHTFTLPRSCKAELKRPAAQLVALCQTCLCLFGDLRPGPSLPQVTN